MTRRLKPRLPYRLRRLLRRMGLDLRGDAQPESYRTYSQGGEDVLVLRLLTRELGISQPTYLDIGANHPTRRSNTYLLYRQGCRGACIEPDPAVFRALRKRRPRDLCLQVAVCDDPDKQQVEMYLFQPDTLTTMSAEEAERIQQLGYKLRAVVAVPAMSLTRLIESRLPECPDFLSIDIEGMDLAVLKTLDLRRLRPAAICVETVNFDDRSAQKKLYEIIAFLRGQGYIPYADTYINTIFVDETRWAGPRWQPVAA